LYTILKISLAAKGIEIKTKRILAFNTCRIKFSRFAPNNTKVLMRVPSAYGHLSYLYSGSVRMVGVPEAAAARVK
jgi:hypothetical protein